MTTEARHHRPISNLVRPYTDRTRKSINMAIAMGLEVAHPVNGVTSEVRLRIDCKRLGLSISSAGMVQDALLPQLAATVGTYWIRCQPQRQHTDAG